jgi:small subunit ribosomal protein S8
MSMTDPISDLLTRIRNAYMAKHRKLEVPASKMKLAIVKILKEEGYVDGFDTIDEQPQGRIQIQLKYRPDGSRAITGLERVSKPGRRIYRGKSEIPSVLGGLGITILSTPKGVITGNECKKLGVGGEVLCNIW